jgi:hypothetical protein
MKMDSGQSDTFLNGCGCPYPRCKHQGIAIKIKFIYPGKIYVIMSKKIKNKK